MSLGHITEKYNDDRGNNLCHDRVNMEGFHEHFQEEIIQEKIEDIDHEITEQLHFTPHLRIAEYYIFHQEKTEREAHAKRHEKSGYMGLEGKEAQVQRLSIQDIFITDIIDS
jgi:hypothetical protein